VVVEHLLSSVVYLFLFLPFEYTPRLPNSQHYKNPKNNY
jgi:hypothetical protein